MYLNIKQWLVLNSCCIDFCAKLIDAMEFNQVNVVYEKHLHKMEYPECNE